MKFEECKQILYAQQDGSGWVAEIPEIKGCYALMKTPEEAKTELRSVLEMIAEEFHERENA